MRRKLIHKEIIEEPETFLFVPNRRIANNFTRVTQVFKLLMPLYGIFDVEGYLGITVHDHAVNCLLIIPVPGVLSLYIW